MLPEQTSLAGVKLRPSGRVRYCDPGPHGLAVGDRVVVETEDGPQEGRVVIAPDQVVSSDLRGPMDRVLEKLDPV